jgi:AraC-like DNA-binding protein
VTDALFSPATDPGESVTDYLRVEDVADRLGKSPNTISDLLSRAPITSSTNPLGPVSRPARRLGMVPLYSKEQVDEALRRQEIDASRDRHFGGADEQLPTLSIAECRKRGLITLAETVRRSGLHEQTLRRWTRDDHTYPPAVALQARPSGESGVPMVVRDENALRAWLIENKGITI